jgi:hypothetical protein
MAKEVRPVKGFALDGKSATAGTDPWVGSDNKSLDDDDVMCLVEVPERYESVTRRVLRTPASVREEVVPAQYATVTRQVIDQAASVQEVALPASYQTITSEVLDIEALKSKGYKINDSGDIVETPLGERVLRAAAVRGEKTKTGGALSGHEGYVREVKIPALYGTVKRQVIDTPASVREIEVPAVTRTVSKQVVKTPASTVEEVIPAVYRTASRQVVDQPATSREIKIPAEYRTVTRQVVDRPPSSREIAVPAQIRTVGFRVIDAPATTREELVPAVYKTVSRQVVDTPATMREAEVPAQYDTLTRQVKVAEATTEWRSILCETNATPDKIREIQQALATSGFSPGPIDGVIRQQTMSAVNAYQQAKGLPVDAYLNLATVKSLGVTPN